MNLIVKANYGSEQKINISVSSIKEIDRIVNEIDWRKFHQVSFFINETNWLEVSGTMSEVGLACVYEDKMKYSLLMMRQYQ